MDCPLVRVSPAAAIEAVDEATLQLSAAVPAETVTAFICGYTGETDFVAVSSTTVAMVIRTGSDKSELFQLRSLAPDIGAQGLELHMLRKTDLRDKYSGDAFQAAKILFQAGAQLESSRRGEVRTEPNGGAVNVCLGTVRIDGVLYYDPVVCIRKRDAKKVLVNGQPMVADRPHSYGSSKQPLISVLEPIELLQVTRGHTGKPVRYRPQEGSLWRRDYREIVASFGSVTRVVNDSQGLSPKAPTLCVMMDKEQYESEDASWCSITRDNPEAQPDGTVSSAPDHVGITAFQAEVLEARVDEYAGKCFVPVEFITPESLNKFVLAWDIREMLDRCSEKDRVIMLGSQEYPTDREARFGELYLNVPDSKAVTEVDAYAWMR